MWRRFWVKRKKKKKTVDEDTALTFVKFSEVLASAEYYGKNQVKKSCNCGHVTEYKALYQCQIWKNHFKNNNIKDNSKVTETEKPTV